MVIEHERVHESKSNTDRFIVSRYGQNVEDEEDARPCFCFVMLLFYRVFPASLHPANIIDTGMSCAECGEAGGAVGSLKACKACQILQRQVSTEALGNAQK